MTMAILACHGALADDTAGWYAGANLGLSSNSIDNSRVNYGLQAGGITTGGGLATSSINDHNQSIGGELFGGYQFNDNFALEGGYFNLGQFDFTANTIPTGTLYGDMKVSGLNLNGVTTLPLTDNFSLFGLAGLTDNQVHDSFSPTGAVQVLRSTYDNTGFNYKLGVGIQYAITPSWTLRLEEERYRVNDAVNRQENINLISLGVVYHFGVKTPELVKPVTPIVPVMVSDPPVPMPVQVVLPPPPPKPPVKVSFSAALLFDFDKATLKPAGTQVLDKFAADISSISYESMTVTGHSDRLGSHAYNLPLSLRRAEAVKKYLTEKQSIGANKIVTKGVNGAEPVTKPGECIGDKATKKLIACLAPDRRMEIEVTGIK